ncbi:MAG TPA: FAD-binding oxidoreductase [Pseudonocardiaceae bacterium]
MSLAEELRAAVPGLVVRDGAARDEYGRDEGYARRGADLRPELVALPSSTSQVSAALRFASARRLPVVPWGSGSSLEGQGLATHGGLTVDLRGMARVRRLLLDDFQVEVDAGILYGDLNRRLRDHGVFFPPNPGAPATVGGMISNNSSGSRAVKYGVTRDYVVSLEVVLADGRVTRLGSRSRKSASGYDLVDLVVGAEGTLCVVTGAVLRVAPTPVASRGLVAWFPDVAAAAALVQPCLGEGHLPATLELLDERVAATMATVSPLEARPGAVLLIECDGPDRAAVDAELAAVADLVRAAGGELQQVDDAGFRAVMAARKTLGHELVRAAGVRTLKLLDVAVPLSEYAATVAEAYAALERHRLRGFVLGHAGDGNLHVLIASDWRDEDLWARTQRAELEIVHAALEREGTITGEHGIGAAKRHLLRAEHGTGVDLMAAVKCAFDPEGIMNPGKVLPDGGASRDT